MWRFQGIRRVTAVTGPEAQAASQLAADLQQRLQKLDVQTGPSLESDLTTFKVVSPCLYSGLRKAAQPG